MEQLKKVASIKPKSSNEIKYSKRGLGFEKLDRDAFDPEKVYDRVAESGAKWAKLFKFTNPEELLSKPLIVDAIAAMPNISPEDSALFNLEKPARIKVGEDLIELHFISFEDNKAENKLGNIKTSLRK